MAASLTATPQLQHLARNRPNGRSKVQQVLESDVCALWKVLGAKQFRVP
jgi:hypothetical protein